MESSNARRLQAEWRMARMPLRGSIARDPTSRLKARRTAVGKARQAPRHGWMAPAMPARAAKMEARKNRKRLTLASIHALPATGFSRSRPRLAIASRRGERPRQLRRAANTAWWARLLTATARRIQNYWEATAFITARLVVTGWPLISRLNLARERTKSSHAKCVKTD